jgi:hypothetical protein
MALIYGSNIRYMSDNMLGAIKRGATLELLDPQAVFGNYNTIMIKVKTLNDSLALPAGTIGWLALGETSFAAQFEQKTEPDEVLFKNVGLIKAEAGTKGEVTNLVSTLCGSTITYAPELVLDHLEQNAKLELVDPQVIEDQHSRQLLVKVKTLEKSRQDNPAGSMGWVRLADTSFAAQYEQPATPGEPQYKPVGLIRAEAGTKGKVVAEFGASLYGSEAAYTPTLYLGGIERGAPVELVDPQVIFGQFDQLEVKVKALPSGPVCWVNVRSTEESLTVAGPIPEQTPSDGTVTAQYGTPVQGSTLRYSTKLYLDRLYPGNPIQLVDRQIVKSANGTEYIKVQVLLEPPKSLAGRVGWVALRDTSFAGGTVNGR